jgi:hypothetical protein
MPVPSKGHDGFPSFPVVDWFCLFLHLWVLPSTLEDFSKFGNFVITLIYAMEGYNIIHDKGTNNNLLTITRKANDRATHVKFFILLL